MPLTLEMPAYPMNCPIGKVTELVRPALCCHPSASCKCYNSLTRPFFVLLSICHLHQHNSYPSLASPLPAKKSLCALCHPRLPRRCDGGFATRIHLYPTYIIPFSHNGQPTSLIRSQQGRGTSRSPWHRGEDGRRWIHARHQQQEQPTKRWCPQSGKPSIPRPSRVGGRIKGASDKRRQQRWPSPTQYYRSTTTSRFA